MSDVEAGPASAPDPPPPLEAENSLEDVDGDASLLDSPGPGDPDDSLALEDPPLVDAPEPGGTDDRKALVTEESAADGHEEKDTPAGDEEKPDVDVTADVQKETPEQVEGPVEEFPADNTPDVIVTLVILPENFQHVLNVKAMTTGAELKDNGADAAGSWVVGKRWKVDPDSAAPLCGWYAPPPWALTTQQIASARRSAGLVSV